MAVAVTQLFKKGGLVARSGRYVCLPCGYIQYFESGSLFTECQACLAGTDAGPEGFGQEGEEFWQPLA